MYCPQCKELVEKLKKLEKLIKKVQKTMRKIKSRIAQTKKTTKDSSYEYYKPREIKIKQIANSKLALMFFCTYYIRAPIINEIKHMLFCTIK